MKHVLPIMTAFLAASAFGSSPVYERTCSIMEDAGTRVLHLRTRDLQFKAVFEMNAADPQRAELTDVKSEFSPDLKIEKYRGRIGINVFGPSHANVEIEIDRSRRSAAGMSPTGIRFRRFLFGRKNYTAECSDWTVVAESRW